MKRLVAALLAMGFPGISLAASPAPAPNFFDLFYAAQSEFKESDPSGDAKFKGNGFGVRALVHAGELMAFHGDIEKSKQSFDSFGGSFNLDLEQTRVGVGFATPTNCGVFVDWLNKKLEDDFGTNDSIQGWGITGRLAGDVSPQFHAFGELGYQKYKDDSFKPKGFVYGIGATFDLNDHLGIVADYQSSGLKDSDSSTKLTFTDLRIGLRASF